MVWKSRSSCLVTSKTYDQVPQELGYSNWFPQKLFFQPAFELLSCYITKLGPELDVPIEPERVRARKVGSFFLVG